MNTTLKLPLIKSSCNCFFFCPCPIWARTNWTSWNKKNTNYAVKTLHNNFLNTFPVIGTNILWKWHFFSEVQLNWINQFTANALKGVKVGDSHRDSAVSGETFWLVFEIFSVGFRSRTDRRRPGQSQVRFTAEDFLRPGSPVFLPRQKHPCNSTRIEDPQENQLMWLPLQIL